MRQLLTPFGSPALSVRSPAYPQRWEGKVPLRVVMVEKACCLRMWVGKIKQPTALQGTIFDVWVDWNGSVLALFESGEVMGLRPHEYRVVEWHLKGDQVYG